MNEFRAQPLAGTMATAAYLSLTFVTQPLRGLKRALPTPLITGENTADEQANGGAPLMSSGRIAWRLLCALCLGSCSTLPPPALLPEISMDDAVRFYNLYDQMDGKPDAEAIKRFYLTQASPGLRHLAHVRDVTAESIAASVRSSPNLYQNGRSCLTVLPSVRTRLAPVFARLVAMYPEADRATVTILVSRGRPLAIAGPGSGIQISLEAMCSPMAARFLHSDLADRFVHTIAHEYIHAQQPLERRKPTVLERALEEGVAEFLGELISGDVANLAVHKAAAGREAEIERRFAAELHKTDLSPWFDNTTDRDVGQLGYWVGYRIAHAYYKRTRDKKYAVRALIRMGDARAFLAVSGWRPSR